MPVDIQNVLVCDAVDESCIQLLKENGIKVISAHFLRSHQNVRTLSNVQILTRRSRSYSFE